MVHRRTHDFLADLANRPEAAVLVVSHSAVIRSLLAEPLGVPLAQAFDIVVGYGSVSKLRVARSEAERPTALAVYHNR